MPFDMFEQPVGFEAAKASADGVARDPIPGGRVILRQ